MKKIIILGHSHMAALKQSPNKDDNFEFYSLVNRREDFKKIYNEINCNNYSSVVLAVAGNRHNTIGLLNHPVSFDFYLPERLNYPLKPNSKLIPVSLITKIFERELVSAFNVTRALVSFFKKNNINKIYHIESPPPISSEHIQKYPGPFEEKIEELGISPIEFRYKLWRLHSKLVRENCEKLGVTFIETPKESQDENGYLRKEYWNPDPTHANALYGGLVLNQIRAIHNINLG